MSGITLAILADERFQSRVYSIYRMFSIHTREGFLDTSLRDEIEK